MKHLVIAGLLTLALAGCGGGGSTTDTAPATTTTTTSAAASGCSASGLDAMTALSDFQLQMNAAQKAGKITVDQLIAARDKLFKETQAAQSANNWTAYCKAIDDMRAELGL
ncbi:MAG TPA: hypothetical protein PK331_17995 [Gordonia sp. (in: high G+C Gram-positive bacteria)]|uniref:hypothetical protein n=1 Tax=unclassified Gordonia (in: high G+C Gram-positive bacteria) TaxID=2657482 RepID=UPI000FA02A5C|nr:MULTISPECIES: hypothetical protein [unclassified Gordonia (in: high G+C Gram-positive bacteria)]RUP40275.1 MAG: hypothetical protein EKK60_04280 [Gordonia sp. (in: high G+C Gram-positive bacteria)]HNP57224.1 hypothetical protein [Gordonia sp. (in: high G+C Gram-positive bacteria)]HRC52796.1 hypothetical protein [Gordonia sp. (in: high G+C Gram-positive bacteria)]